MTELWVDRHRPESLEGVAGNKKAIEQALEFVRSFRKGKALLLHGPPGIGKSLVPWLISQEQKFHLVEINASDERGKDKIKEHASAARTATLFSKGRIILIDEADGISGRDRGAVQALASLIKSSSSPVFVTANDPWIPKLRPLRTCCRLLKFNKIPSPSIEKFLRGVCEKESVRADGNVLKNLARFSEGDLRAAITDLQVASVGKKAVSDKDLEAIGYRERSASVFGFLPTIFRSGKVSTARKLIFDGDKDPDEVFWWIENNSHLEFSGSSLEKVFDLLSKADIFRSLVMKQQNWAFKGYMVDLMAGVSVFHSGSHKYAPYKAPDKFIQLARTKQKRALVNELCEKLGKELLHCSKKVVRKDFLPYLKILLEQGQDLNLEEEDVETIKS